MFPNAVRNVSVVLPAFRAYEGALALSGPRTHASVAFDSRVRLGSSVLVQPRFASDILKEEMSSIHFGNGIRCYVNNGNAMFQAQVVCYLSHPRLLLSWRSG